MRRRLNLKLLVVLLAGLAPVSVGVHQLHGYQVQRNASSLLKRADRAEARGDAAGANKLRERYLGYVPDDREVLTKYALTLASDDFARTPNDKLLALAVLEKALLRDPNRDDARRRAARLAMDLQQVADARGHLEILLKSNPEDAESELLLGRCNEAEARFADAAARYESARQHRPALVEAYVRLADLLRTRMNDAARADQIMDAVAVKDGVIAANGKSARAYLERARYRKSYQVAGSGLADDLAKALELDHDDADVIIDAASAGSEAGRLDEAQGLLARGLARYPRDARMYLAASALEVQANRPEEAIARLKGGEETLPDRQEIVWARAEVLIQLHRPEEASLAIARLAELGCPSALRDYLKARIAFDQGKWADAASGLEASRVYLVSRPDLADLARMAQFYVGRCHEQLGNPERQLAAYRRVIDATTKGELDPIWVPAHFGAASAWATLGKLDEAIEAYRRVASRSPEARLAALKLLVVRELRLEPAKRRWPPLEQALQETEAAFPGSLDVAMQRVEILVGQGKLDAAQALLRATRDKSPDRLEAWTGLAALAVRRDKPAEAEAILDEAVRKLGDRVDFRLLRASLRAAKPGPDAVKALEPLEAGLDAFALADRQRLLARLAQAHARVGDADGAGRLWSRFVTDDPANLSARLELFDLASQAGDEAGMERILGEVRKIEGEDGYLWRFGRARLLIRQARVQNGGPALAEARALLGEVAARRADWAPVASASAEISELEATPERALADYRKAIDQGLKDPAILIRALRIAMEQRQFEEADRILGLLKGLKAAPPELERLESEIALRLRDVPRAVASARRLVAARPDGAPEHLWLAQVLRASASNAAQEPKAEAVARREEAVREARRAVELGPADPEARVTLVRLLAEAGRLDQARAATEQARQDLRWEPSSITLAVCHEATGRMDLAGECYQTALKARPDDPATLIAVVNHQLRAGQIAEALVGLQRLAESRDRAPREAAWAARTRAILLAARGNRAESLKAIERLDGPNDGRASDSTDDLRATTVVLSLQPDRSLRSRAIRSLQDMIARRVASPDDRYRLAQLYQGEGEWSKARNTLEELLAHDGENPNYLASYADLLRRRGSLDEARLWLAKLERVRPGAPETVGLKARLARDQGRDDDATATLRAYAALHREQAAAVAALLEELKLFDAAEALYRAAPVRPTVPEDVLALAGFLARRDRFAEALPIFERAWKTGRREVVSSNLVLALHESRPDDRQLQTVAGWIEAAVEKDPSSRSLRFDLANIRCFQGRHSEAKKIFLSVFEENPSDGTALNNIAWMLANLGRDFDEALDHIDRAIAIRGPTPELLDTRALVRIAQGQGDLAVKDLDDALAGSELPEIYYHMARARLLTGDRRGASDALKKVNASGKLPQALHPLERAAHRRLVADLAGT